MRVRPLARTLTVVRFSKLARSCAFAAPRKVIAHNASAAILFLTCTRAVLQRVCAQKSNYIEMMSRGLFGWAKWLAEYRTYAGPDSCHPSFGLGLEVADDTEELLFRPVVAGGCGAAAGAVLGGLRPVASLDGGDEVREAFEEACGTEVVDHVEQGEFYRVGE